MKGIAHVIEGKRLQNVPGPENQVMNHMHRDAVNVLYINMPIFVLVPWYIITQSLLGRAKG